MEGGDLQKDAKILAQDSGRFADPHPEALERERPSVPQNSISAYAVAFPRYSAPGDGLTYCCR